MKINKMKTIARWSTIIVVSSCYFIALFFAKIYFSNFIEKESMKIPNSMTIGEYHNAVNIVQAKAGVIDEVGFFGFFICITLILFIFKKTR